MRREERQRTATSRDESRQTRTTRRRYPQVPTLYVLRGVVSVLPLAVVASFLRHTVMGIPDALLGCAPDCGLACVPALFLHVRVLPLWRRMRLVQRVLWGISFLALLPGACIFFLEVIPLLLG